jgi:outer membrane protein assembly factor BamB
VFTLGDFGETQYVIALDATDGTTVWRTPLGPSWANEDLYPGSRSTPTLDGGRLFVLGTEGTLSCLEAETGELVWRRNVQEDFGGYVMMARAGVNWRYTESPLIDGDRVVVTPGAPNAAIVSLDKRTGEEIWRTSAPAMCERGDDGAGYSSIVISHGAGVKQYVQISPRLSSRMTMCLGLVGAMAPSGVNRSAG